jgi:hypothetical protein
VLFTDQTADAIVDAVRGFEASQTRIESPACVENARRFEPQRFRRELAGFVDARWAEFAGRKALQ